MYCSIHTEGRREGGREQYMQHTHQHAHLSHLHNCEDVIRKCSHMQYQTHTHTHERITTHIAVGPSVVRSGDLLVCRPSSYCRLFRLGWREEEEEEQIESKEGGMREAGRNVLDTYVTSMYRVMWSTNRPRTQHKVYSKLVTEPAG